MDLFKLLRAESLKRRLPFSLLLLALGAALFFTFSCFNLVYLAFPWSLNQLAQDSMEGVWVSDTLTSLHKEYAQEITRQEGQEDRPTGAAYIIPLPDGRCMGVFFHEDTLGAAQALLDASHEGGAGLRVRGQVRPMDQGHLALYTAAAEQEDEDGEQIMLPFYIDVDRLNGRKLPVCWAVLAASCVLMTAGLAVGGYVLAGGCQRALRRKAAQAGNLAMSMSRVERFYHRTPPLGGVRVDRNYVMFRKGAVDVLLRPWDVTWVYSIDRHDTSRVIFRTGQEKRYTVKMPKVGAQALFQHLEEQTPGILLGYTKERAYAYQCDPTFAHRWEAIWPGCTYKR